MSAQRRRAKATQRVLNLHDRGICGGTRTCPHFHGTFSVLNRKTGNWDDITGIRRLSIGSSAALPVSFNGRGA